MPLGLVWLAVGVLIGAVAGWLLLNNAVAGGAAGFIIALVLLLIGNWLGGEDESQDDVSISG